MVVVVVGKPPCSSGPCSAQCDLTTGAAGAVSLDTGTGAARPGRDQTETSPAILTAASWPLLALCTSEDSGGRLYFTFSTIPPLLCVIFILCIVYNVHRFFRYYPIIQCLELGASQQSFALASEILTTQAEQELGRKQALCRDCAVISQGFYSRSEKLNTNFYTDSAEVRHLGTWAGQLSGIQSGPGSGVRVPRRVVTQLIGGSWGRKLGSSSPVVIMQPVRNQFELLKVSTNGSLPLPAPAGAGERKQVVVAGVGRAAVVTGA